MPKKSRTAQSLVNTYPPWSNIRTDEQSLGFQLFNNIGILKDDLVKQGIRIGDNYFLSSSIVSDIDLFYQHKLPGSFEFTKEDNDQTELLYTAPSVSGLYNNTYYQVSVVDDNSIEGFWYNAAPSRISLGEIASGEHLIASGYLITSPFEALTTSGELHIPNKLSVTISGGNSFVGFEDNNLTRVGTVQVEGITRAGLKVTEELTFIHDETVLTFHDYRSISLTDGVRAYGINDDTSTFLRVTSGRFKEPDYPVAYEMDEDVQKRVLPLFWAVGSGVSTTQPTLDLLKYNADDVILRMEGFVEKSAVLQQELLTASGVAITAQDLAVEPRSSHIWVVGDNTLYLYTADLPYPTTNILEKKDYSAESVIEPNSYYAVLGEDVQLDYVWRRPVRGMVRHRVWVTKPDGTTYSIEDGAEVAYHTDDTSWVFGEPRNRVIRPSDIFTLDQRGDWLYSLEVYYADNTSTIDQRIISVVSQEARAEFDLTNLGITNAIGVDFDSEYKLWVMDQNGAKYQINKHYDIMIIDFDKKIIYFREPYDEVRVF